MSSLSDNDKINIPRFPTLMVVIASILTCLSLVWFGFYNVNSAKILKDRISQSLHELELRGMILQLDEVLTMSARMYASTGNYKWAQRYNYYNPILDNLVKEAGFLVHYKNLKELIQLAAEANNKLDSMEKQAFIFVREGQANKAKQILFGPDYEKQKKIYSHSMQEYGESLKKEARIQISEEFRHIFFLALIFSIGFISSLIAWIFAFRNIKNWKSLLTNIMINELKYKRDLEESRHFLEQRVKERTDELEVLNRSLQNNEINLKNINKALKESESRFHLAIESTPVGMAILTLEGKFIDINQSLCNLFGYSKDEMLHMKSQDITYPEDFNKEENLIKQLVQNKIRSFQVDKRYVHKDGRVFWALLNASLLRNQDGKPPQLICQVQDITSRKQYEKEIIELNDAMSKALNELKQHEYEMTLLNKMNEMLQSCQSSKEAYSIIDLSAHEIFSNKEISGGLAIFNEKNKNLELIGRGGRNPNLKDHFTTDDCWGLRMGHVYILDNPRSNLICTHFQSPPEGGYICMPLIVRNRIIGLLNQSTHKDAVITKSQQQLCVAFGDVIKLSLANIKLRENLQEQSIRDPLTGLFNRRYLDETLPRELQRIVREDKTLTVAMLDLDNFKNFNDVYGHEAGDEVLKFMGKMLLGNFRGSDIVCRFGGEEFVVTLFEDNFEETFEKFKRLQAEIQKREILFRDNPLPKINFSIGITQAPQHGATAEAIIAAADKALYDAKKKGKNRVEIFRGT